MDKMELLQQLFELCIVPLLAVLTNYLVKFIKTKAEQLAAAQNNELTTKYINMLQDTITQCVISTNQTFVSSLKASGAFTKEAQEEAFEKTYNAVFDILSDEAKNYLDVIYGDLDKYITQKIEAEVNLYK